MRFAHFALVAAWTALASTPGVSSAKIRVAASINDLASIASTVGGDQVEAFAIARPNTDVHRVEVLPSYMIKVSRANLYLKVGMSLDQWADGVIDGSRNTRLKVIDCSQGIAVLEKPTGQVSAAMGDVHPSGNPHYWLDPRNGATAAHTIAEALAAADPAHAAQFRARADAFGKDCEAALAQGRAVTSTLPAKAMLTYHRSWTYLADAFGLNVVATVEPVPGIPPTARHLAEIVQIIKVRHVPVLLQEPYFSDDAGKFLNRQTGLRVVVATESCDATAAGSYLSHLVDVLRQIGGKSH